jgi:hypothetical protein
MTRSVSVAIGRGENYGRTVTYSNVVRRWMKIGEWSGKAATFDLQLKDLHPDVDSVAVVVQSGVAAAPKQMLGAAQVALR